MPYIVMHEFEGLLFSDPDGFGLGIGRSDLSPKLRAIRNAFGTPEEINDSPDTAPSKRVEVLMPGYQKPLNGVQAAQEVGLDAIRGECPLFPTGCIGWSSGSVSSLLNPSRIDRGRLPLARRVVSMLGFAFQIFREEGCAVSLPCRSRVVI